MKPSISAFSIILFLCLGILSCNKDGAVPDMGYNYFPDQPGKYVIYDFDSIFYDDFVNPVYPTIDTFHYQIKEKIQSIYSDNQGRPTIRLERYIRANSTLPWILKDVWAENKSKTSAEKVEENVRFVKLSFPVKANRTWDGNAQNTFDEETYKYEFFDLSKNIGTFTFDSSLQVTQHDEINLILKMYFIEQYARNVGMVYKEVINIESQPDPEWNDPFSFPFGNDSIALFFSEPDIMKRVTKGYQFRYTINSFGVE